ncbi:hypothetical protein BIW11_06193 [Tropilaelaps mercedesae]|uniref:Uncharacterized protein n=1 Tax=Tropilaelaps mercedesae TaxID=418985 RepID=A0A1V9XZ42_9ACAR|nr:hypothetical protein BIW11_06193 [Tropilaelaps mercedesae]
MEKIQQPKFPLPLTIDNPSKQFIAEEKRLADGRNTYIISEVERGQSDIISKLRGPFNPTSMNANNIYNTEHHNGGPNHDWNLSLPAKKILTSPQLYDNKKNFNNFANIFSMESGATYDGNSNSIGYSGPNFGSDYGSVLELQNAKLRMQSSNNLHSNSINSNIQYSENNLNSYHQFNQNHSNNSNNSEYDSSHHNGNNKKFSQQKYKRPLVIAVGSVTKDSWGRQKDIPQWSGTRNGGRKTAIATSHERTNIQVLRTDKESKVVIPPGIIAILVPQNFGVSADTGTVTSSDAVDFDNGDQPIYESSSTTKKTVAASQAVVSDVLSNNGKVEPSKSPGPPYKVDFTQRLPPNAITAPEMFVPQIQNRMGSSTEATSSTSASKKVSIQKTSMPIVLTASTEKQLPRKNEQTYIPFPVNPSKNPELARRINNIHAQIQLSNSKNQRKTSTSARPAVNHWTSTATQRETTHLPLYQYPVKSSKTGHRQFQTRLSTPKSQISNRFLQDNQQYSTPVRRIASTTAMPVRYLQYQQYPQRTTLGYLNNHQVYTSPLVFSPAAFGSESAAIYLPRAATLKKPRNKILKNEFFNHYAVPDSTRSSQTFSFHGLLQSRSVTHPQQSILYREQQISRNDNRINLPFYINAC